MDEDLIAAIISNRYDDLTVKKADIVKYYSTYPQKTAWTDYLRSIYQDRFTEYLVDGVRVGCRPQENGLLMWKGSYLSRTSESVFSWDIVAELTAQQIEQEKYLPSEGKPSKRSNRNRYAEPDRQQLSLFDAENVVVIDAEETQLSFLPGPQYSQAVIDEALRVGANDEHSRLIICAYFMKDKPLEENVRFLQNHYGTNGAGFYHGNQQYAIWYDTDGIQLAAGNTVHSRMSMTISWDTAAERIRELLDEGRYMSQEELDRAADFELNKLSNEFALAARDLSPEARDLGLAPTIAAAVTPGVFPESADNISALISDPKSLQTIIEEWTNVVETAAQSQTVFRWRVPAQRFLDRLQDMQIQPLTFYAAEGFEPQRRLFISADEIDNVLRRGTADYRLAVYSFYQLHANRKAREKFLKDRHGEYGGFHGGNDNLTYTGSEGINFSHGSITAPYAEVQLSWSKAAKRIGELIQSGRFLLPEDRAAQQEVSVEAEETVLAPDENEMLQESIRLINEYCQSVFETDAEFRGPVSRGLGVFIDLGQ